MGWVRGKDKGSRKFGENGPSTTMDFMMFRVFRTRQQ